MSGYSIAARTLPQITLLLDLFQNQEGLDMNVEMARQGRIRALSLLNSDRLLVRAAQHGDDIALPSKLSIDSYLLSELHHGLTLEKIVGETGWSSSKVMEQLYKAAKKARLGIERRNSVLHLVYPDDTGNEVKKQLADRRENHAWLANANPPVRLLRSVERSN